MPRARINGLSVHYQQAGRGPNLVLVHGLFCNLAFWYVPLIPLLGRQFRITVYDLRGHGHTERKPSGYRAIDLSEDLVALLDYLDIAEAHLVGHSFGGAVALACAARHPQRSVTLTLADAWVPSLQPLGQGFWQAQRRGLEAAGLREGDRLPRVAYSFFEELIEDRVEQAGGASANPLVGFGPGVTDANSTLSKKWWQLVEHTSAPGEFSDVAGLTRDVISTVAVPLRAVAGQRSRFLPTLQALQTLLPSATSAVIPGVGHFFPLFRPELLVEQINRFISEA